MTGAREAVYELMVTLGQSAPLMSRMCGEVRRYHCWRVSQEQTVADHTFHAMRIYSRLFGMMSTNVAHYLLHHDMEMLTGDVQHPSKAMMPELRAACEEAEAEVRSAAGVKLPLLADVEKWRVKMADLLEMYEFGTRECMAGNWHTGQTVRRRIRRAIGSRMSDGLKEEQEAVSRHCHAVDGWILQEGKI